VINQKWSNQSLDLSRLEMGIYNLILTDVSNVNHHYRILKLE